MHVYLKTMSSEGNLDVEEFENVPLVRMEDVQPSRTREKVVDDDEISVSSVTTDSEAIETFTVDGSEMHCIVDDDDSNIGSMVSIKTDHVEEEAELIVPEMLETDEDDLIKEPQSPLTMQPSIPVTKTSTPGSWPTLEILPGGVINLSDKASRNSKVKEDSSNEGSLMYACAKCPERFKYLVCLVKHVRLHEDEERQNNVKRPLKPPSPPPFIGNRNRTAKKIQELVKRSTEIDQKFIEVTRGKEEEPTKIRKHKISMVKQKYICLDGGTIKLLSKPKRIKVPKRKS